MSTEALEGLTCKLLEYLDWERALDHDPELARFHDGRLPPAVALELGGLLSAMPERALHVVVRTIAWGVMEPGCTDAERAQLLAAVQHMMARREQPASSTDGVVGVAQAGFQFLTSKDPAAFASMLGLLEQARSVSYPTPTTRAGDWSRWLELVARSDHGEPGELLPTLLELIETTAAESPRRFRVALFDNGEFSEVWSANRDFEPVAGVLRLPTPQLTRRVLLAEPEVIATYASPMAVEYLVERTLLFGVLANDYRDMVRRIDYKLAGRSWSHNVE